MAREGKLRPRRDGGGCSLCYASDENVGKRRCCHVLSGPILTVREEKGIKFVDISGKINNEPTTLSIKANKKIIKEFTNTLRELTNNLSDREKALYLETAREK